MPWQILLRNLGKHVRKAELMNIVFKEKEYIKSVIDYDIDCNLSDFVYSFFMNNDEEIIYVVKAESLVGCISIGDAFRYFDGKNGSIINNSFTKLCYGEIERAREFFSLHWSVNELPVVDEQGKLIGLYLVEGKSVDRNKFRTVLTDAYYGKRLWVENMLEEWLANSSAKVFGFKLPIIEDFYKIISEEEGFIVRDRHAKNPLDILQFSDEYFQKTYWGDRYTENISHDFCEEFEKIEIVSDNGFVKYRDFEGEYFCFKNGFRVTPGAQNAPNKIFLVGPCTILGAYVCGEQTIGYYLQKELNEQYPGEFEVINWGTCGPDYELQNPLSNKIGANDYVIIGFIDDVWEELFTKYSTKNENVKYLGNWTDVFSEIERPSNCILDNCRHSNYLVNKLISNRLVSFIKPIGFECSDSMYTPKDYFISWEVTKYYKDFVATNKLNKLAGKIGSIVMNCNPFTRGHRYLIETASGQCDSVIVFVVEEDKSTYKFKDRIEMVKRGVKDLENVIVVPSGKYIISNSTFAQYFEKDKQYEEIASMDYDIHIFGEVVAKVIGITNRFVGEEPLDPVTCEYNNTMKRILPKCGIDVVVIPRKEVEKGNVISATKVRAMIANGEWEKVLEFAPESTVEYLKAKHTIEKGVTMVYLAKK